MKKNIKITAIVAAALFTAAPIATVAVNATNTPVSAATQATKRKLIANAYIYNKNAKRLGTMYYKKGTKVATYGEAIKINGKYYYSVGSGKYVKRANFQAQDTANTIKMPAGYYGSLRRAENLQTDSSEKKMVTLSKEGVKNNVFHSESTADDKEKATPMTLTTAQKEELNNYATKLLNEARKQVNSKKVYVNLNIQDRFTNDNNWDAVTYTFKTKNYQSNMTGMKRVIYNSLKKMLFNAAYPDFHSFARADTLLKDANSEVGIWFSGNDTNAVLNWGVNVLPTDN